MLIEAEQPGYQQGREAPAGGVVLARDLVVASALDGDSILGALQLGLQIAEALRRRQLGIVLDDDQQPRQSAGEGLLSGLELLQLRRRWGPFHVDRTDARTRLGDRLEGIALEIGRALDGRDQVRHQVGTALVDVLDLAPGLAHLLVETDHPIVGPTERQDAQDDQTQNQQQRQQGLAHVPFRLLALPNHA